VAFWKEKVDLLLLEKKEALHEQMSLHKLIRDYESQLEQMRTIIKERDACIEQFTFDSKLVPCATMLEVESASSFS
jgi:hypothetical protein